VTGRRMQRDGKDIRVSSYPLNLRKTAKRCNRGRS
jgi:hypothetical protein